MHHRDRSIGAIAGVQDNVITREQLLSAGVGRRAINHRRRVGGLHRLHRGVYLVGHAPPTPAARARAAVLASGPGAVVSHRSGAELWGLMPESAGDVHVTVAGRNPGVRAGIHAHRVAELPAAEVREVRGIPLTSPARTICDIAGSEPSGEIERALEDARVRRLVTDRALRAVIERAPTRNGSGLMRALLAADLSSGFTRSEAERRLRRTLRAAELPLPLANVRLHGFLVDFLWPAAKLIVEVDGYEFHKDRAAFERDRRRDQILTAAGYRVIRVTWRQLRDEPMAVIVRLAQTLVAPSQALAVPPHAQVAPSQALVAPSHAPGRGLGAATPT